MKEGLWTLEGAMPIVRRIAAIAKEQGFTVALYGTVLSEGQSDGDLDLYSSWRKRGQVLFTLRTALMPSQRL